MTTCLPLVFMLARSLFDGGQFTLKNYQTVFSSAHQWKLLANSIGLAFLVTLLCAFSGVPLGCLLGKTDLRLKSFFLLLFSVPLVLPPFILCVGWFHILGRQGFVAKLFGSAVGSTTSNWLFGLPGCVLVLTTSFLPVVLLITVAFFKTLPPEMEEAGLLHSPWSAVLNKISLPLIKSGIILGLILVFILTLGELTVPLFLRYPVFAVETLTQFSAFYNFGAATAAAVPFGGLAFLMILLERNAFQTTIYFTQKNNPLLLTLRQRNVWSFTLGCAFVLFIAVPITALVWQSASFNAIVGAFHHARDSLVRTVSYSAIAASILVFLGFCFADFVRRKSFRFWTGFDSFTLLLFAIPGTVLSIGLISVWNRPSTNFVYTTPVILLTGYLIQYIALSYRITLASLNSMPPALEHAAYLAGASWFSRSFSITIPLIFPGLLASWLVSYIFCFRDTGLAMILYPPGKDTFSVRIFTLMANSPPEVISALCLILIFTTLIPFSALAVLWWCKGKR
jgi:iron(III) transport system permease protein